MKTDLHWSKVGKKHHHGIALSLSSLRSQKSSGIGEFLDLLPMIDWCHEIGLDVIQLLPLNDTGIDKSPYNALSSLALDPLYLSLWALPNAQYLSNDLDPFIPLTQTNRTAANSVKHEKIRLLTRYFHGQFETVVATPSYQNFLRDHPWVRTYALFKTYKDEFGYKHWKDWPDYAHHPTLAAMEEKRSAVEFHSFLQYLCYQQLKSVKKHAEEKQVFLQGDLPILISLDSADVWAEPHLFNRSVVAGAPPDYYNPLGQKWGFPLYDWSAMEKENYGWWKRRLAVAGEYYHMYRLDHIVGFFRIWAIPENALPSQGAFIPKDTSLWPEHGRKILEMMIDASPMLPLGEDLGTIPTFVPHILKELGICGTKVLRWQKNWDGDKTFIPFDHYEPLSISTVSTHDSETLTLWWEKYPDESRPFAQFQHWPYETTLSHEHRFDILYASHHTTSLFHINLLSETLALFPELVWPDPQDERINIPGTILPTNWTYRTRPFIEEITSHKELTNTFRRLIS